VTHPSSLLTGSDPVASPTIAPSDVILMMAVLLLGGAAAFAASPILWPVTPVVAAMIYYASRQASRAQVVTEQQAPVFPLALQQAITTAMVQLPYGDAHRLLSDVVRQARPLFERRESAFDEARERETRENVVELVSASCEIALELSRLDHAAPQRGTPRPEAQGSAASEPPTDLATRYDKARDLLVKRLDDAGVALRELYASGVEHGTPASDRVAGLVTELRADASARSAANTEMNELLGPG
jgi:hypothetical protein